MALQTKTFSKSNNTFTLKLTVTENSTSVSGNSSSVSYKLELVSTTKDFYQYSVGASVSLNGRVVATRDRYSSGKINLGTYSSVTLLSGSTTIGHNNDGSKTMNVAYSLDMASASYTPGPMSGSGSMPLTTIPREAKLTSAPNFTDEDNPTIRYSNPGGFPIYAYMDVGTGFHPAEPRQVFGSSYTFNLTESERNALRSINTASNTQAIRFVLRTDIGTTPYYSWLDRTLTIENPAPTLSPTVKDTNSTTVALTGGGKIVRYESNAKCTFNDSAVKFATIKSRKVTCGGKSLTANGTISGATSGDFNFSTTDSRGNTTSKRVSLPLVQYILPTCYIGNNVPNAVGEYELECTGSVFVGSFGAVENDVSADYRYREKGADEWGLWISLNVRTSGQTYTATANLSGLDYQKTYEFQCRVIDRLNTAESDIRTVVSRPVFDWSGTDFNFNVPLKLNGKNLFDLIYPVGSIYISVKSTNPGTLFGGTWVAWGAGRVPVGVNTSDSSFNTVEKTGGEKTHKLTTNEMPNHGHQTNITLGNRTQSGSGIWASAPGEVDSTWVGQARGVGGSAAHNNLQPYITCYMWKRTA